MAMVVDTAVAVTVVAAAVASRVADIRQPLHLVRRLHLLLELAIP